MRVEAVAVADVATIVVGVTAALIPLPLNRLAGRHIRLKQIPTARIPHPFATTLRNRQRSRNRTRSTWFAHTDTGRSRGIACARKTSSASGRAGPRAWRRRGGLWRYIQMGFKEELIRVVNRRDVRAAGHRTTAFAF